MNGADPAPAPAVLVTRRMLHDLMNHLTVVLGNSELLVMDLPDGDPSRAPIVEIQNACREAIKLVKNWPAPSAGAEPLS